MVYDAFHVAHPARSIPPCGRPRQAGRGHRRKPTSALPVGQGSGRARPGHRGGDARRAQQTSTAARSMGNERRMSPGHLLLAWVIINALFLAIAMLVSE